MPYGYKSFQTKQVDQHDQDTDIIINNFVVVMHALAKEVRGKAPTLGGNVTVYRVVHTLDTEKNADRVAMVEVEGGNGILAVIWLTFILI